MPYLRGIGFFGEEGGFDAAVIVIDFKAALSYAVAEEGYNRLTAVMGIRLSFFDFIEYFHHI